MGKKRKTAGKHRTVLKHRFTGKHSIVDDDLKRMVETIQENQTKLSSLRAEYEKFLSYFRRRPMIKGNYPSDSQISTFVVKKSQIIDELDNRLQTAMKSLRAKR